MSEETPQPGHILSHVLAFTHLLREMGVDVSPGQALELVRALEYAPITNREDFRGAARCTLIRRHEDLPLFDAAFAFYWRNRTLDAMGLLLPKIEAPIKPLRLPRRPQQPGAEGREGEQDKDEKKETEILLSYSASEALRQKDFGTFTWEEVQACKALLKELSWRIEPRKTRRKRPTARGRQLDMRRVLRRNLRYGGELL